jgi:DeoR/GlpR family transcriptional regulator of sugar metabolism
VKERGEIAIRSDVIAHAHGLNARQAAVLDQLFARGKITLSDLEEQFPEVNRRTLQRDLRLFASKGLLRESGTGPTDPNRHYVAVTSYDTEL